ncbi:CPBP family glutamic-type intramembrane protease [Vagococcus lutrae]|uniref:CPBP family glutamic-type intramembrane protease n=2 Tax=Vagococcus lutrae TaxID=81947 RepID=UPI00339100EF
MNHILLLRVFFILTLFPGGVFFIFFNLNFLKIKKFPMYISYVISVLFIIILYLIYNLLRWENGISLELFALFFLMFFTIFIFVIEKFFVLKKISFSYNRYNIVTIISVVLYPVIEEINFRYNLFQIMTTLNFSNFQFMILSTLSFTITHVISQGNRSLIKLFFALYQSLIFVVFENIYLNILTHVIFNFFVSIDKNNKEYYV